MAKRIRILTSWPGFLFLLILLVCAVLCRLWIEVTWRTGGYQLGLEMVATLWLGAIAWIVVAVRSRGRMVWRQLLIWAPAVPSFALLVAGFYDTNSPDIGLEFFVSLFVFGSFAAVSLCGSIAALVRRPEDPSHISAHVGRTPAETRAAVLTWTAIVGRNLVAALFVGGLVWLAMSALKLSVLGYSSAPAVAAVAAAITWTGLAVLERTTIRVRLLMVWLPTILPFVIGLPAIFSDTTGFAGLTMMTTTGMFIIPSVFGSIAVLAYRPDELAARKA